MNKKYELTNEFIEFLNCKLYHIKALRSFSDVKEGDLGGFVEKEDNLSHDDNVWEWLGPNIGVLTGIIGFLIGVVTLYVQILTAKIRILELRKSRDGEEEEV